MNTVDRLQQFRLDDQRTSFPSLTSQDNNTIATNQRLSPLNEQFFDQLSKCQVRLTNQNKNLILKFSF